VDSLSGKKTVAGDRRRNDRRAGSVFFHLVGCYELFAILDRGVPKRGGLIDGLKRTSLAAIPFLARVCLYLFSPLHKVNSAQVWVLIQRGHGVCSSRFWTIRWHGIYSSSRR
jgi:hypothetical protein